MNLKQVKYFYWVSKLASYSRAAEELDVSEPCVFRLVQNLEHSLRTKLLIREHGRIRPTRAGRVLQAYAEKIDILETEAERSVLELAKSPDGMVLFGVTRPFADIVADSLASWKSSRPDVRVGLAVDMRNELYIRVLDGELQFAFAPTLALPSGLTTLQGDYHDEVLLVGKANHPLAKRRTVSIAELGEESFITSFPNSVTYGLLLDEGEKSGIRINVSVEVDRADTLARLVVSGMGIGVVSKHVVREAIRCGLLSVINVRGDLLDKIPYGFVFRSGSTLSEEANSLIAVLSKDINRAQ